MEKETNSYRSGTFYVLPSDAIRLARMWIDRFEKYPEGELSIELGKDKSGVYFCSVEKQTITVLICGEK